MLSNFRHEWDDPIAGGPESAVSMGVVNRGRKKRRKPHKRKCNCVVVITTKAGKGKTQRKERGHVAQRTGAHAEV